MQKFSDTVNDLILDELQIHIGETLFEQWNNSNLDESVEYAEFKFFAFADEELKNAYNEFYGYKEGDEFYL